MKRRTFVKDSMMAAAGTAFAVPERVMGARIDNWNENGYFRLKQWDGRWWLTDPRGDLFFSQGLNHVDPASLRYPENVEIWNKKYGNSMERWLKESVRPNLLDWGFNTLGWNREVVTRALNNHRHSRAFTYEEYQWLGMPYCHQLPFGEFHQWEAETRHPDFFSQGFIDWCDFVAREHCVPMAEDPKLIGYFYIDCPTWLHTREESAWKGPLFDPVKLESEAGREELLAISTQYYRVTHEAIRRYDPNHLILGDRYEANEPLAPEIMEGARPYVDVLSFQDFREPVEHLQYWHEQTGMPVLWADGARKLPTDDPTRHRTDGNWYRAQLEGLVKNPGCVGAHLCGAYIRNKVRQRGLIDRQDRVDEEMTALIREANHNVNNWVKGKNAMQKPRSS